MTKDDEQNSIGRRAFLRGAGMVGLGLIGSQVLLDAADTGGDTRANHG